MERYNDLLTRGIATIIPNKQTLSSVLESGKKLTIFMGIDPTATRIHLGHGVQLRKLQSFANLGHKVIFLIGDFTARIGDTSDKDSERPVLTLNEIEQNFQTYKKQAEKILDFTHITIVHNSDWLKNLTFADILSFSQQFSLNDFISRELIKKRLQEGKRVRLDEVLYPLMQGYDSMHLNTDIQIGGSDQIFNMQAGRTLIKQNNHKESYILSSEFLPGTDGRKMSKSWGNAIWLDDSPSDMYAKIMAINDDLISPYYTLATDVPLGEIETITTALAKREHPLPYKKVLAHTIVAQLYSSQEATQAQEAFETIVQKKEEAPVLKHVTRGNQSLLVDIALTHQIVESKAEWKRLIQQNGITLDGELVQDVHASLSEEKKQYTLSIGKRKVYTLT